MTPDFLAGLLIGSFAIYACWLLSLRRRPIPACPECRPGEPHFADCPIQHPDAIGDALIFLGETFSDDA